MDNIIIYINDFSMSNIVSLIVKRCSLINCLIENMQRNYGKKKKTVDENLILVKYLPKLHNLLCKTVDL